MAKMSVSEVANYTSGYIAFQNNRAIVFIPVDISDIDNIDYVTGCQGKVKEIIEYEDIEKTKLISRQVLKYQNATYPTFLTCKEVYNI